MKSLNDFIKEGMSANTSMRGMFDIDDAVDDVTEEIRLEENIEHILKKTLTVKTLKQAEKYIRQLIDLIEEVGELYGLKDVVLGEACVIVPKDSKQIYFFQLGNDSSIDSTWIEIDSRFGFKLDYNDTANIKFVFNQIKKLKSKYSIYRIPLKDLTFMSEYWGEWIYN